MFNLLFSLLLYIAFGTITQIQLLIGVTRPLSKSESDSARQSREAAIDRISVVAGSNMTASIRSDRATRCFSQARLITRDRTGCRVMVLGVMRSWGQ